MNQEIRVHLLKSCRQRPNLRLKLTGLASRELLRYVAGGAPCGARFPCASRHVARSLSAVR
jgi:hypothetical protein